MQRNLITWITGVALLFLVISCEDHQIPTQQRFRLKKFTNYYNGIYNVLNYSSNGKLANVANYASSGSASGGWTLYYDNQGNVQKSEQQGKLGDSSTTSVRYTYGVDANGNITAAERREVSIYGEFIKAQYWLTYSSNSKLPNQIIEATGSPSTQRQYTYNDYVYSNGNAVTVATRITFNTGYDLFNSTQNHQYDSKPNPFYGLILGSLDISLYGIVGNNVDFIKLLSKNNVLDPNYDYAYDANGYLVSVSLKNGQVQNSFEYEVY